MKSQFLSPSSAPSTRHVSQACSSSASLTALVTLAPAALAAQGGNPGTHFSHASLPPPLRVPALLLLLSALGVLALSFSSATAQLAPPGTPIYETIRTFGQPSTGGGPAALIRGLDGAYYGVASQSNSNEYGTVFKIQSDGSEFTVLHRFVGQASGAYPSGRLVQASDGLLYGACRQGGLNNGGTLFNIHPDGSGFAVIHHFASFNSGSASPSSSPTGGLIIGQDGALYGTSKEGGIRDNGAAFQGDGTLFRVNRDGNGFTILHNFTWLSGGGGGAKPNADLVQGLDGTLYGTSVGGGFFNQGSVFKLNPDGSGFGVLFSFETTSVGGLPSGGLIFGPGGWLYGTTTTGSTSGGGTAFKLNPSGTAFSPLVQFSRSTTGAAPLGTLVFGTDGRLYGTTVTGGALDTGSYRAGTVFRMNADGSDFAILKHLEARNSGGGAPNGGLCVGVDGSLYGTTMGGGATDGGGTVFKLNSDGSNFQVLKSLSTGPDMTDGGGFPTGGVMQGTDGALYGANLLGGNDGYAGTLYKMNLDGSGFAVLRNFNAFTTGGYPLSTPIQGREGMLYGTVTGGEGAFNQGALYRIAMNGSGFTNLHLWDLSINGGRPMGRLVQGSDGVLYGTTMGESEFSRRYGTAYKINPDGTGHTILHLFDPYSTGGANPEAGLTLGTDGVLYGVTPQFVFLLSNGTSPVATLFRLNTNGTGFGIVHTFDSSTGISPSAEVTQGVDGALYGGAGSVFRVQRDGSNFSVLQSGTRVDTGVIQGIDGRLYGVAPLTELSDKGYVFSMLPNGGGFEVLHHFSGNFDVYSKSRLLQASDGNLYGTIQRGGANFGGSVYRLIIGDMRINALSPRTVAGGSEGFTLTVEGFYFAEGAVVEWDGVPLPTQVVDGFTLTAEAPATAATLDLSTVRVTVRLADETVSAPELFIVTAGNVAEADGTLVEPGLSVSVSTAPVVAGSIGVSATLSNTGGGPATLTVANYTSDPSGTVFSAGGGFTDVQITGADLADTAAVSFYYPSTIDPATEAELSLMTYDGTGWITVRSNGDTAPVKNTADNLDGTVSGGRFTVVFGATSTPKITELGGTIFAMGTPYGFDGFLAPIGGADHASGGSFGDPLRTFKARSTIPVKFRASATGQPILTGVHTLRARKFSSRTTGDAPIDASPQGKATTGNRFELLGHHWQFNLDTKATGLTTGIWQLTATLADGSQHFVWIQIK